METGKRMTDMGGLPAASLAELEPSDTGELDFVVWYFLDMTDQQGNQLQYQFSLPKPYAWHQCQHIDVAHPPAH